MIHVRRDYDAVQPWPTKRPHHARRVDGTVVFDVPDDFTGHVDPIIPDDEPVLLIRGQDPLAYELCLDYADRAEEIGCAPDLVDAVRRHAGLILEWAQAHPHGPADAPAGSTLR